MSTVDPYVPGAVFTVASVNVPSSASVASPPRVVKVGTLEPFPMSN